MSETAGLLERRYWFVLGLLPGWYREIWAEEMVAAFLEGARASVEDDEDDVDLGRPRWSEVGSVVALAVRVRVEGSGATPRSSAWAEAFRRVALLGLLVHAVAAVSAVVSVPLVNERYQPLTHLELAASGLPRAPGVVSVLGLLWVLAYLCLVLGRHRFAQLLAVVALIPSVVSTFVVPSVSSSTWLAVDALPVLALVAFHRDAPSTRARPWLVAVGCGIVTELGLQLVLVGLAGPDAPAPALLLVAVLGPDLWFAALAAAVTVQLLVPSSRGRLAEPRWSLSLGLVAAATCVLRVDTVLDLLGSDVPPPGYAPLLAGGIITAAVALALALVFLTLGGRALRRLSATPREYRRVGASSP